MGPGAAAARAGGAPRSVPLAAGDGRPRHQARRSCRPRGADGPERRSHRGPPRRPLLRRHADNRGRRAGARANRTPGVPGRVRAPGRPVGVRHAPRPRQRASPSCTGGAHPTARPVVCRGGHRGAGGEASPAAHHHPAPGPDRPHRAAQPGRPVATAHLCLVYEVGLCTDGGAGARRGLGLPRARGRSHGDGGGPTGRGRPAVRDRRRRRVQRVRGDGLGRQGRELRQLPGPDHAAIDRAASRRGGCALRCSHARRGQRSGPCHGGGGRARGVGDRS